MKNWYGIKKLNSPNKIKENTIIYSPNGVMKTSFADGIKDLIEGKKPRDVFNDLNSEYEIEISGKTYNEENKIENIDILVYGVDVLNNDIYNNKDIAKLFVSKKLKKEYEMAYKGIKKLIDELKDLIVKDICRNERANMSIYEDVLNLDSQTKEVHKLINFLEKINPEFILHENVQGIKYFDIFMKKDKHILTEKKFNEKLELYNQVLNRKRNQKMFKNNFTLERLETVHETLKTQKFYEANHQLYLNEKTYNEVQVKRLIEKTREELYGDEEVQKTYKDIANVVNLKKNEKLMSVLNSNQWILEHLDNVEEFKQRYINTNALNHLDKLEQLKKDLIDNSEKINNVIKKASKQDTLWDNVINKYNDRFENKHYDIIVKSKPESLLELSVPTIEHALKSNGKLLTKEIQERFSSGEKRAYFILSMIYEIELKILDNKPFVLILDDIVNSFDYKNKFAMIEYLKDLSENKKIQLIILTHNFDFYRSIRISLGENIKSKLLAYNNENAEVDLIKGGNKEFESFQFVQNWKNQNTLKSTISLIPVLRNISELKDGTNNNRNYMDLTDFLHYKKNTEIKKIKDLIIILKKSGIKFDVSNLDKLNNKHGDLEYFKVVEYKASQMIDESIKESDLQSKVFLGIYIRLATDKMLYEKYVEKNNTSPKEEQVPWTRALHNNVKKYLSPKEKSLFNEAIVVAPTFIHLNSFMYEPLVDVGVLKLKEIAMKLYKHLKNVN